MAGNDWSEELKTQVIDSYLAQEPTPENTMDIVKKVAVEFEKTPNGVRTILSRASVYVKKVAVTVAASDAKTGSKRINKSEAIQGLKDTIEKIGQVVDDDICDRFTGKAADYLNKVIQSVVPG